MSPQSHAISLAVPPEPTDHLEGSEHARVTLVEYGDFECPSCKVAVWSHYAGSGPITPFVRIGTLDAPDVLPPDVHIFTSSKQPWVHLPQGMPAFAEYYDRKTLWSSQSLERFAQLQPRIEAYKAGLSARA